MQKNVGQSSLSETNILPSLSLSLSFLEGFASTNKNIKGKNVKCIFYHAVFLISRGLEGISVNNTMEIIIKPPLRVNFCDVIFNTREINTGIIPYWVKSQFS